MAKSATRDILHLVSANIQGLRDREKRARFKEWTLQHKTNIVFIQESHFTAEIMSAVTRDFHNWHTCHSFGTSSSRAAQILYMNQLTSKLLNQLRMKTVDLFYLI